MECWFELLPGAVFLFASVVIALVFQVFIIEACQLSFIIHLHTGPTQEQFQTTANTVIILQVSISIASLQ